MNLTFYCPESQILSRIVYQQWVEQLTCLHLYQIGIIKNVKCLWIFRLYRTPVWRLIFMLTRILGSRQWGEGTKVEVEIKHRREFIGIILGPILSSRRLYWQSESVLTSQSVVGEGGIKDGQELSLTVVLFLHSSTRNGINSFIIIQESSRLKLGY